VILLGFIRARRTLPTLISLFVIVRLGLLLVFAPVSRYLLPLLPFLVIFLAAGLGGLSPAAWRRQAEGADSAGRSSRPLAVLCLLLLLPALVRDGLLVLRPPARQYPDAVAGGQLIAAHAPPGAVVLTNWSSKSFYLYDGGQRVVEPERGTEQGGPDALLAQASQASPATHLLLVGPPLQPVPVATYLHSPRLQLLGQRPDRALWLFAIRR